MGISKTFNKDAFKKLDMKKNGNGYSLSLNFSVLGDKLDRAQAMLDAQVWADVQKYMPMDTGSLIAETDAINKTTRGEVYLFPPNHDYGHYLYEGILYVDPTTGSAWAPLGETKVPTEVPLQYHREGAQAHWAEPAFENHKKEWIEVVKRAMN